MYKTGTVILIPFPFTDLSGTKVRPAIIISHKVSGDDVVVLFLSSNLKKQSSYTTLVQATEENGLKTDSVILCSKVATLDKKVILGELGILEQKYQKEVKSILKKVFGL